MDMVSFRLKRTDDERTDSFRLIPLPKETSRFEDSDEEEDNNINY